MSLLWLIVVIVVFALLIGWWMTAGRPTASVNPPTLAAADPAPVIVPDIAETVAVEVPPTIPVAPVSVAAAPTAAGDNLLLIKGIGPALEKMLLPLGVERFDQIAAWTPDDVARIDGQLGRFKGRIERDAWIEQAGLLARGDTQAFEAKFGKL